MTDAGCWWNSKVSENKSSTELCKQRIKAAAAVSSHLATSLLMGDRIESELFDSLSGNAFVVLTTSHLKAALTFVHLDTFGLKSLIALCRRSG